MRSSPPLNLDPRTYARGLGCVHCGLCLPACPTYTQTWNEADSPRGRIQLMLALHDRQIEPTAAVRQHLDLCLDCRACETACPSGVVYHELIEETRTKLLEQHPTLSHRAMKFIFFHILTHPTRLKLSMLPGRLARALRIDKLLPPKLAKMMQLLPKNSPLWPQKLPRHTAATSPHKARVVFFPGCIGSVIYDRVNRQALEVLAACGADVTVQPGQVCCGAIHHHNGDEGTAIKLACRNIDTMLPLGAAPPDFIATDVAGCGAMLREYDFLLRGVPLYAERARRFVALVRDVSEVLMTLGLPDFDASQIQQRVTYHDACHLAHAQRVTAAPRQLLAKLPGVEVAPLPESDMCCGAAGTYNLNHPDMADDLAVRKLQNIASTRATICVSGNVGCTMHLQGQAESIGQSIRFAHPVELIHLALFGASRGRITPSTSIESTKP